MERNPVLVPCGPEIFRINADDAVRALLKVAVKDRQVKYGFVGALIPLLAAVIKQDRAFIRFQGKPSQILLEASLRRGFPCVSGRGGKTFLQAGSVRINDYAIRSAARIVV